MILQGKVAVVTGGTRGIGRAICERLQAEGATVVAASRSGGIGEVARGDQPGRLQSLGCDVTDESSVAAMFATILRQAGRIDVLVNNAGVTHGAMLHKDDVESFRRVLDVNLVGTWLCTREAVRVMRVQGSGSVINIGSMAGKLGNLGQAAYASSKAGVVALTKTTAREGAGRGIRCNAIQPGLIDTDMTASMAPEAWTRIKDSIPMGRPGSPDEVANVAAFLASDLASYVTGCVIDVAGGRGM